MDLKTLETVIADSLTDFKLDQSERYEFAQLAKDLDEDKVGFIKNKAFDLSRLE